MARTNPVSAFAQLALVLIAAEASHAQGLDPAPDAAEPPSTSESTIGSVDLFGPGLDISELDASGPVLDDPVLSEVEDVDEEETATRFEPFVAPIPFRSPSIGWGGALTLGAIVRIDPSDRVTPPSTVAVAGFGSENESFGGVFSFRGHLLGDLLRPRLTYAQGRSNYDFFGVGSDAGDRGLTANLRTEFTIVRTTALVRLPTENLGRLGRRLYLGPLIEFSAYEHGVRSASGLPPNFPLPSFDEDYLGLGFAIERDTRDDIFAPSEGTLFQIDARFFSETLSSDEDYETYDFSLAGFHAIGFDTVLGWRGLTRLSGGDVPFNELGQHDLRGYERGRYRDEVHVAGEVELRRPLFWRFSGVTYAGLGQVAPELDELNDDSLLWSAGFGLRFQLTRESQLNYRSDVAWGRDGFEFYFSLGEEF